MPEFNRDYVRSVLEDAMDGVDTTDDHKVQEITDYIAEEDLADAFGETTLKILIVHMAGFYDWIHGENKV